MATFNFLFFVLFVPYWYSKKLIRFFVHLCSRNLSAEKKKKKIRMKGRTNSTIIQKLQCMFFVSVLFPPSLSK